MENMTNTIKQSSETIEVNEIRNRSPQMSSENSNEEHEEKHIVETLIAPGMNAVYNSKVKLLNDALQDIGMGRFQWTLFVVAGFGWFMDNFWMLSVSLISVPVKAEFNVEKIAYMTLYKYLGLVIGATGWPLLSDLVGRLFAFNVTIFMSSISALIAAGVPNYGSLNFFMFCIGFATGGNQPVDGMLFVELIPASHQHLLLYESLFWGFGQFVASIIGWPLIVNFSCSGEETCTYQNNLGWRYTYWTLGGLTLLMSFIRLFANMYESPKFYIGKGKNDKAVDVVKAIAKRNNTTTWLTVEHFDNIDYELNDKKDIEADNTVEQNKAIISRSLENFKNWNLLFKTKTMTITTLLLWVIWGCVGMGFPLFNSFLPFYLEWKGAQTGSTSLNKTYRDYAILSVCAIPSGIFAGYLSNVKYVGRKGVGFIGGVLTGVFMYLFTTTKTGGAYLGFTCVVSFVQMFIYGAMYAYTPEVFPAPARGAACASCSFWNRICGLMGPVMSLYLDINNGKPVFVSGALFIVAGVLFILLPYETRGMAAS
ncbi:uncharacterized protein PRCAT00002104001 [Priceomyces carsonii]|uniref:uncharacterized protein n=1 Tax=Priceomyces carsonii TaxID=28549 RepID=UPI002EDA79C5|nr:unnamed protein product [Priceomyces carsonii]